MAKQEVSLGMPRDDETMLRLTMTCMACGTLRTFNYIENLGKLLARKMRRVGIEIVCDRCQHSQRVDVFWSIPGPGYSSAKPPQGDDVMGVDDGMGLEVPKERYP